MRDGRLQAYATPTELYAHPMNRFVAGFIGSPPMNFIPADLAARNGDLVVRAQDIELLLPPAQRPRGKAAGATVGVRPEHIALVAPGEGQAAGEVYVVEPVGREQIVDVQVGGRVIRVVAPPGYGGKIGDRVGLRFALERLHLFDPQSGDRLA
jgi:ABC-type sugar transport system ATPase subunit